MSETHYIPLKVYSVEEIELFLNGDRKEVDRLLLHGMNNIARIIGPHIELEEHLLKQTGGVDAIKVRADWVDLQIDKQKKRNEIIKKICESTAVWAVILMVGFLAASVWDHIVTVVRQNAAVQK